MDSKIINRRLSAPSTFTANSGENHKLTGKDNQLALSTNNHLTIEKEFSSSKKGVKWISSKSNFEKYVNKAYFLQINLVFTKGIDHQINNYNLQHFLEYDFSILISIESKEVKNQTNFFWRIQGLDIIYCLKVNNDLVSNCCQNLLIKEVRNCRTGILPKFKKNQEISITEIGDKENSNLLILAAKGADVELVENLLCYNFNVDYKNSEGLNAIECAFLSYISPKNESSKQNIDQIIMNLLRANSKYPEIACFSKDRASKNVRDFMQFCEGIHVDVDNNNIESIEAKLKKEPKLIFVYNKNNKSLMSHAIQKKKPDIHKSLIQMGLNIGTDETTLKADDEIYETIYCKNLRRQNKMYAKSDPKAYLNVLKAKSKISFNNCDSNTKWKNIEEAFKLIDSDETCSMILKVVAVWKSFSIFFDFTRDSVDIMDPTKSKNTLGTVYNTGDVYIGAIDLLDDDRKYQALGVLIHELCHFALLITFMNNFNPYPMGPTTAKQKFEDDVTQECDDNRKTEPIVENVFNYSEEHRHSELIVTVVQMIMQYFIADPNIKCQNSLKMEENRNNFEKLFNYFKKFVEPEFRNAINTLEDLQNEEVDIDFESLTDPMKAKVLHSLIDFQGIRITINEIIGKYYNILEFLTPKCIRDILLNRKDFTIGKMCNLSTKYKIMERRFVSFETELWCGSSAVYSEETIDYETIAKWTKESKVFILADTAGTGKTTTLEYITKRLKKDNPTFWVSLIQLNNHDVVFSEHYANDLVKFLIEMLNIRTEFEKKIFECLFNENKVIFLFDGIDEVKPRINNLMQRLFCQLNATKKIQIWISTRPQYAKKLKDNLKSDVFKFVPYTWTEKSAFIEDILSKFNDKNKKSNPDEPDRKEDFHKDLDHFKDFFRTVENRNQIDNPLMIEIIAELYAEKMINLKLESLNLHETFDKIIKRQMKSFDKKIDYEDRDPSSKFTISEVHQYYGLKLIFLSECESQYGIKLEELQFMKNWKKHSKSLKKDQIQRYGILTITTGDVKELKDNIDFIHRTYAEFFVAEYLLTFLYQTDCDPNDKEFCKIIHFILFPLNRYEELQTIREFVLCKIKNTKNTKIHPDKQIHSIILKWKKKIRDEIFKNSSVKALELCSFILSSKDTGTNMLKELWQTHKRKNLLRRILCNAKLKPESFKTVLEVLQQCFGENWDRDFCILKKDLFVSYDIFRFERKEFGELNKNLIKVLDLIKSDFSNKEKDKCLVYFIKVILEEYLDFIDREIIIKCFETFLNSVTIILLDIIHSRRDKLTQKCVEIFVLEVFRKAALSPNNDKKIREILFPESTKSNFNHHPFFIAVKSTNTELLLNLTKIYVTKNSVDSMEVIQNMFSKTLKFSVIFSNISEKNYEIFLSFMKTVFANNENKLKFLITSDFNMQNLTKVVHKFKLFEHFLNTFFDLQTVKKVIRQILFENQESQEDLIFNAIKSNIATDFQEIKLFYLKYRNSHEELQNIFMTHKHLIEISLHIEKEIFEEFCNFLKEVFATDENKVLECISDNYEINLQLILSEHNFENFRNLIGFIFNEYQVEKIINDFLTFKFRIDSHPLINAIKEKDLEMFKRVQKIFKEYQTNDSWYNIQEILTHHKFPQLILSVPSNFGQHLKQFVYQVFHENKGKLLTFMKHWIYRQESEVVLNEKKFKFVEEMFKFALNHDRAEVKKSLKEALCVDTENLSTAYSEFCGLLLQKAIREKSLKTFHWVRNFCKKYKSCDEELQNIFISSKCFIELYCIASLEISHELQGFIKEVFLKDKSKFVECVETTNKINFDLIMNEEKFEGFEDFLHDFFDNSELELDRVLNSLLFQNYPLHIHPLFKAIEMENLELFNKIKNLYVKYKTSWQQLQDVLMKNDSILPMFKDMRLEIQESCKKFLIQVFRANKENFVKYFDQITHTELAQIIENEESFKIFEDLFVEMKLNGEFSLSKSKMISRMLMKSIQTEDLNIFRRIKIFYTNYKKSWDDIQNIFISQKIFPEIFFSITTEICHELCEFTNEVFSSNKTSINLSFKQNRDENFDLICNDLVFNSFEEFVVKICGHEEEIIKQIIGTFLFYEYSSMFHPFLIAIRSNNLETFERISNIYKKYTKSSRELQDFLISDGNILKCFESLNDITMSDLMCSKLTEFFDILFENDKNKLVKYLSNQSKNLKLNLNQTEKINLIHFLNTLLKDLENTNDIINFFLL